MSSSGHQKSSVAQTCNLLSQYLKGNGRLGISTANLEANKGVTINFLPNLENNSAEASKQKVGATSSTSNTIKATDFFQDIPSFASTDFINIDAMEHGISQMTIFYNGRVLVFNDCPAEKAKEIMALANKIGSSNNTSTAAADKINPSRAVTPDLNMTSNSESNNTTTNNNNSTATPDRFHQRSQAVPIARRASLHRFFEKRKDRATARAPYQVNNPSSSSSSMAGLPPKPEDQSKYSWLQLQGQSSKQLDLNL